MSKTILLISLYLPLSLGAKSPEQLLGDLRYGKPEVREAAVEALAEAGAKKAVPALIEALSDSDGTLKLKIVQALGTARDSQALPALSGLLSDPSPDFRAQAAKSLGRIADPGAGPALEPKLKDSDAEVRAAAALALGQCRARSSAPALKALLKDPQRLVKLAAVDSLGLLGDAASLPELKGELKEKDPGYRRHVVKAIGLLSDSEEVTGLLGNWLDDSDLYLRTFAAEALASRKRSPSTEKKLLALLADPSLALRIRAVEALGAWKSKDAVPGLKKTLRDGDNTLRWKAAMALGRIGDPAASDALKYLAENDAEVEIRKAAAEALDLVKSGSR